MKRIATGLSIAAALMVLSNCTHAPFAETTFDARYERALNGTANDRNICRFGDHDFRDCR